ncbi:MAG TPA: alkaline phosphatase family protein [Candidatus Polarisedimenticolia bacterium]|nr:alkaline phosphatase family protein [Candidatus Polarisedimenticolia bacterium]
MKRRSLLLVLAVALAAGLPAAGLLARRGIVRVPADHFAIAGNRVLAPGWHLTPPLLETRVLEREGDGALPPLPLPNREGVKAEAVLSFYYRVRPETLAEVSRRSGKGFHALLEKAARDALAQAGAARSALELLDPALARPVEASLNRSLASAGIEVSALGCAATLPGDAGNSAAPARLAQASQSTGIHLLLIGLDAADWESIDPLLAEGKLPNLAALIGKGVRGPLRSYNPMVSPLLWTTIATGKGPDLHGVADFSVVQAKTGARVPISSTSRKVRALWDILSELDRRVAVVGWWASFPADPIHGVMVTDRVAALSLLPNREALADRPGYTQPPDFLKEILSGCVLPEGITLEEVRRFAEVTPEQYRAGLQWIAHPPEPPAKGKPPVQDPVGLLIKILAATRNYHTAALQALQRGPFDLTAVYFEGIDLVGHRFQHYRAPRMQIADAEGYARFHDVVTKFYIHQDRLVGELIRKAGPGTTVLVLSDHGFKTGASRPEGVLPYTVDQPVEWHREDGIFILSGPGAAHGTLREPATLFDITPTILALLGAPLASDMPGHPLSSALDPAFLREHPPGRIPSYEALGAPRRGSEAEEAEEVSAEMMAQLRALGYVGGGEAAAPAPAKGSGGPAGDGATDTTVSYHRNLATYYLSAHRYQEAIDELNRANQREKLPKSYGMLAEALDALGRKPEALAALEEGWKEVPEAMAPDSVFWYVQLSADLGDAARGRRFLDSHAVALNDTPALRAAAEGVLAASAGDSRGAEEHFLIALRADPTLVAAARPLAEIAAARGNLESLRPLLEAGLRRSDRIDEYHNLLGALDSKAGRKEQALAHFRRACELSPADPRFALNLSLTLMDLQRWSEAAEALDRAVAITPGADLFLALGNARLQTREPEAALAAFRRASEAGADPARAELGIALSTLRLRGRDEALALARDSLARHPENPALAGLVRDLSAQR